MGSQIIVRSKQFAYYWLVPEGIRKLLRRLLIRARILPNATLIAKAAELAKRNLEFRDRHLGQRCFILATGPSVNSQDLRGLSGELCIAAHFFFLHPQIKVIKPRYHVITPNHPPFDFDIYDRFLGGIANNYGEDTITFYGYSPFEFSILNYLKAHPAACRRPYRILDFTQSPPLDEQNYAEKAIWDIAGSPFTPRTVIYSAVQLAVYMGCKEIFLIGCDHDYLQDLRRRENHFYSEATGNPNDAQHLDAFTMERWFQEYYCRWRDYRLMKTHLTSRGVRILNATAGGMLDVFPRVELSGILK